MNDKKIKEIEERVEKATPGTWKVEKYYHDEPYEKYIKSAAIVCRNQTITRNDWSNPVEADLDFIAHARQDIPYLLKIINELNDENISIKKWNACEQELYEKLLADSEKLIDVEAELEEYKDLEEQGLLVKLPCKVRDTVYVNTKTIGTFENIGYAEAEVVSIRITKKQTFVKLRIFCMDFEGLPYGCSNYPVTSFGKTVFLTEREIKKALEDK